jgi:exodeoxyribonuclease-1
MTRALRPEGINWPVDKDGKATNRLELLTVENNLEHLKAHDALSDVHALIAVTRLVREKQPKLYEYLLSIRDKKAVMKLVNPFEPKPFVYTSGRYDAAFQKTTVVYPIADGSRPGSAFVYDLRHNPEDFAHLSVEDLKKRLFAKWEERKAPGFVPIPVKELAYNRSPVVAPLGVLEQENGWERIQLSSETVSKHLQILLHSQDLIRNIKEAFESRTPFAKAADVDGQLYDGFINDRDKQYTEVVRNADERMLADFHPTFIDERMPKLLLRYKARNFPRSLSDDEQQQWEAYRAARLRADMPGFMKALTRVAGTDSSENTQFLMQELQLWAESIVPIEAVV